VSCAPQTIIIFRHSKNDPCVPVNVLLANGRGCGDYTETTPTTGKVVVFQNKAGSDAVSAGKAKDIDNFNSKVKKKDAEVFSSGALLYWLFLGNGEYVPRMLVVQMHLSPECRLDLNNNCILVSYDNSSMKCVVDDDDDDSGIGDRT
jgi:hypothetical protein